MSESDCKPPAPTLRSAALIGQELVALFDLVEGLPNKVQWVCEHISVDLGGPLDSTLDHACRAVAASIDAQAPNFERNPYHNRQHFCEVALSTHTLCFLEQLDPPKAQFTLLAALIHDFVHDGGSHPAFFQERASIERARPLLEAAGLQPSQLARMTALVLATDTLRGTAYMAAACHAHEHGEVLMAPVPPDAPELALLAEDKGLASQARILCEADILPSIGLTLSHAIRLQERLSCEWQRPLSNADKLDFIAAVLKQGYVGPFFLSNVLAMRSELASSLHASDPI